MGTTAPSACLASVGYSHSHGCNWKACCSHQKQIHYQLHEASLSAGLTSLEMQDADQVDT